MNKQLRKLERKRDSFSLAVDPLGDKPLFVGLCGVMQNMMGPAMEHRSLHGEQTQTGKTGRDLGQVTDAKEILLLPPPSDLFLQIGAIVEFPSLPTCY